MFHHPQRPGCHDNQQDLVHGRLRSESYCPVAHEIPPVHPLQNSRGHIFCFARSFLTTSYWPYHGCLRLFALSPDCWKQPVSNSSRINGRVKKGQNRLLLSGIEFTEYFLDKVNYMTLRQSNECGSEVGQTESKSSHCKNNIPGAGRIGRYALILILVIFAYAVQWFWIK
jgi:hypothetical protein